MERPSLRVMHLIATNFHGGPERQIVEHLLRLNPREHQGFLASFLENGRRNETLERAERLGLEQRPIPMRGAADVRALRTLIAMLRTEGVGLLCTHGYKSTVMGWCAARRVRIPVVAFSRGYTRENRKIAFYEWLDRQVLSRTDGVVAVSEGQGKRLQALGIRPRQLWVVHNAVNAPPRLRPEQAWQAREAVCARWDLPRECRLAVSAGRLSPEKGHGFLVEAIATLTAAVSDAYFLFCGDGPCRPQLERLAADLGVAAQCRFLGFQRDMEMIYQAMDLLVLPSLTEGLPNVVLEAFAWQKPVVASAVGGVPELVIDGENGILVPPGSARGLADGILRCLASPQQAEAMGRSGYERVRVEFDFMSQCEKLTGIYREVLAHRRN
jgi:glycosyltransferase involved in cell wall biosynthesis